MHFFTNKKQQSDTNMLDYAIALIYKIPLRRSYRRVSRPAVISQVQVGGKHTQPVSLPTSFKRALRSCPHLRVGSMS